MVAWPKLSEKFRGTNRERCDGCGLFGKLFDSLIVWREHDDEDQPTSVAVVLCQRCSDAMIEIHPRLYSKEHDANVPLPGVMELCVGCPHARAHRCRHPDLFVHGGKGLRIHLPKPTPYHARTAGGGFWGVHYNGPPISCAGRDS